MESYGKLRASHEKMKKKEKKKDKFFSNMWKRVKGLWKVIKPQDRLPSPRERVMMRPLLKGQVLMLVVMVLSQQGRAVFYADLWSTFFS